MIAMRNNAQTTPGASADTETTRATADDIRPYESIGTDKAILEETNL